MHRHSRSALLTAVLLALGLVISASPVAAHDPDDRENPDPKAEFLLKNLESLEPASEVALTDMPCESGTAGPFPCKQVDLLSFLPLTSIAGGSGNDIWGWTDPETNREYALMGTSNGTSFVDVTQAKNPVFLGHMPTQSAVGFPLWRDIKVRNNHAFVVSEHSAHGLQVFDLTRLRDVPLPPTVFTADATYSNFSNAHNININEKTGFAYAVGTNTCEGGLHMVNIREPNNPRFAGCFADDGYTHDVQCVVYTGPHRKFRGDEICFASNEDTVTIVDVSDKDNPRMLSRTPYDSAAYTHQGWLTPNQRHFIFGDELDEQGNTVPKTTTYIMDAKSLTNPSTPKAFSHETDAIDHNLYVHGKQVFASNYMAGLRILDYDDRSLSRGKLNEIAFFDVVPGSDIDEFAGTWSNYRFPRSKNVVVSTIESGLFVLKPRV